MLGIITHGILAGLVLTLLVGPVFLALMSITITEGRKKAYRFLLGIALSDLLFAFLTYKGLVLWNGTHSGGGRIVAIIGACIFAGYGIYLVQKKEKKEEIAINTSKKIWHKADLIVAVKGFVLNTVNPSIFIFWITILSQFLRKHHGASGYLTRVFLGSVLITFIGTDVIKIHAARWILKKLTIKNMDTLHRIAGVLLIIAGVLILLRIVL